MDHIKQFILEHYKGTQFKHLPKTETESTLQFLKSFPRTIREFDGMMAGYRNEIKNQPC